MNNRAACKSREQRFASPLRRIFELEFQRMEPPCPSFHPKNALEVELQLIHSDFSKRLSSFQHKQAGFTLLEILLVIVILAVSTALVVPSFFSSSMPSLHDEARRLTLAMKLADEEAALGGYPFRWSARADNYVFETADTDGVWHAAIEEPFAEYALPSGMHIADVQPVNTSLTKGTKNAGKTAKPVLARLLFSPQGVMAASEVVLANSSQRISILLRPGPGGIQIVEETSK